MPLSGKTAIVTGAARGLGAVYARALIERGASVVAADVAEPADEAWRRAPDGQDGIPMCYVRADVARESEAVRLAEEAARRFGGIDILVNNAAVYGDLGRKKPFDEISGAEWDAVMAVNVKGVWQCAKAVVPYMRARRAGKIINVSSSSVYRGTPGLAHYVASKAAVIGLTRVLAQELGADNICVNAVAPGLVRTDASRRLNPDDYFERGRERQAIKRVMEPGDLVGTVVFLASAASDFVTGQTFVVDGGGVML
ncbi:MAG TPA: 3-oxoacyl-ACP reductase family protein [bacterium]|nr:3-oxoacyl-ACP reductase family protein [bacterium]